jgi:hypothetical protein
MFLGLGSPIAQASIHYYPAGSDQVMYRSLQTLRDERERAWQLVLFNRLKAGLTQSIHLREKLREKLPYLGNWRSISSRPR